MEESLSEATKTAVLHETVPDQEEVSVLEEQQDTGHPHLQLVENSNKSKVGV